MAESLVEVNYQSCDIMVHMECPLTCKKFEYYLSLSDSFCLTAHTCVCISGRQSIMVVQTLHFCDQVVSLNFHYKFWKTSRKQILHWVFQSHDYHAKENFKESIKWFAPCYWPHHFQNYSCGLEIIKMLAPCSTLP